MSKKGFTLIELIIVIVIIAILAAIAIPAVSKYVGDAKSVQVESNIGTLRRCAELALIEFDVLAANTDTNRIEIPEAHNSSDPNGLAAKEFQKNFEELIGDELIGKYYIVFQPYRPATSSASAIKPRMIVGYGPNGIKRTDIPVYSYDSEAGDIKKIR